MAKHYLSLFVALIFLLESSVVHVFPPSETPDYSITVLTDGSSPSGDYFQQASSNYNFLAKVNVDTDHELSIDHWLIKSSFCQKRIFNDTIDLNHWQEGLFQLLYPFHEFS